MCHTKCQKFGENLKFDDFLELTLGQPESVPRPKKRHFNTEIDDFQIKNYRSRAAVGGALGERPQA